MSMYIIYVEVLEGAYPEEWYTHDINSTGFKTKSTERFKVSVMGMINGGEFKMSSININVTRTPTNGVTDIDKSEPLVHDNSVKVECIDCLIDDITMLAIKNAIIKWLGDVKVRKYNAGGK